MSEWKRLTLPSICERLVGFSIPNEGKILVISHEGMHLLRLTPEISVDTDDELAEGDLYDPNLGIAHYRDCDYQIIGLHGGSPIVRSPRNERLLLDTESETLSVLWSGEVAFSLKYENFSGDWATATFSPEGRYIVLGCPYDFDFVVLERGTAA
jgi:hypothetical protein